MSTQTQTMSQSRDVVIPTDRGGLDGILTIPASSRGLVIFACEGAPQSIPDREVIAAELQKHGFATLIFDFLGFGEDAMDALNHLCSGNVELLAHRLVAATVWADRDEETSLLPIGYFASGIGSAVALLAAMTRPKLVRAIVLGGGRPEIAGSSIERVTSSTLLIVEGADIGTIRSDSEVLERLGATKKMSVVPGATRRFTEPGALEALMRLATEWFTLHLGAGEYEPHPHVRVAHSM